MQVNELVIAEDRRTRDTELIHQPMGLDSLRTEFFRRMEGKAKNTLLEYNRSIGRLYDFMNNDGIAIIETLSAQNIRDFQLSLFDIGSSAVTILYHIKTLRRFCDFLLMWGLITCNPFKGCDIIPAPIRENRPKRYYSHEETLRWYYNYLKKHYSFRICRSYFENFKTFISYLEKKDIKSVSSVKYEDIAEYALYLWDYRAQNGKNYTPVTIKDKLEDVKKFYRAFFLERLTDENPSKDLNIHAFLRSKLPDTRPRQLIKEKNHAFFDALIPEFKTYITTQGFVEKTVIRYTKELELFFGWLKRRNIQDPKEITKHVLMDYYKEIHNYQGTKGKGWSVSSRHNHLVIIRKFFVFLAKFDYITTNPAEYIDLPKNETGLPTTQLKDSEAKRILEAIDSTKELSLRDRAIVEILYSTAIRANELCTIEIQDVDFETQQIIIRHPKGGKSCQRVVPIGACADKVLKEYVEILRPHLMNGNSKTLFLTKTGHAMNTYSLCDLVKEYAQRAGLSNRITTHSFRVGCATEMLRNGADVRYVQTLLGHKRINTTQIYARVNIEDLKKIHRRYHPREKYYRKTKLNS